MSTGWRRWAALLGVIVLLGAVATGCGVKSQPIPPEEAIPERIVGLSAESVKSGIRLAWARPDSYAGGSRMRDLGRFIVLRANEDGQYQPLTTISVTDQERFQQQRRFDYLDKDAKVGRTYRYEIVSVTLDGYRSEPSNEVEITRTVPKPPPSPEHFVLPTPTPMP